MLSKSRSKQISIYKIGLQVELFSQVISAVLALAAFLDLQQNHIQVLPLHSVVGLELLPGYTVVWIHPKAHRLAVYIHHSTHVSSQQRQILNVLFYVALGLRYKVTVLLRNDMLHSPGRVNQPHY